MFFRRLVAITVVCSSTLALNNTDGFTPWGRPRIQLPQTTRGDQTKCMTTCSLNDPNLCQTICPRDPTDSKEEDEETSPINIVVSQTTALPVASPINLNLESAGRVHALLSPLQETASLLIAEGVPVPSLEDLAALTETLSLLRGLGVQVPPEEESWEGFSLDDKTNEELERMLAVLEPYVGELPSEEEEGEGTGEGYDVGFADILAILMDAEEREERREKEAKEREEREAGNREGEGPIELFMKDPGAVHEGLVPLPETTDIKLEEEEEIKTADIRRRDEIVEKQVNVTEHKGLDGETKNVSVSQTSETNGVKVVVEIDGQEYR
jgi:hypothetical protein